MAKKAASLKVLTGVRLEVVRKALRLNTKQAMADLLKVSHDTYSAWEKGKNLLPVEYASFLEYHYQVSMSWLYSPDPERMALELVRRA